jgi:hypothetical protein
MGGARGTLRDVTARQFGFIEDTRVHTLRPTFIEPTRRQAVGAGWTLTALLGETHASETDVFETLVSRVMEFGWTPALTRPTATTLTQDEVSLAEGLWLKSGFDLGEARLRRVDRRVCRQSNNISALRLD